jgi:hypothetical protein
VIELLFWVSGTPLLTPAALGLTWNLVFRDRVLDRPQPLVGLRWWREMGASTRAVTLSYGGGFLAFALVGASGAVALSLVGRTWEGTFLGRGGVVVVRPTTGRVGTPWASESL